MLQRFTPREFQILLLLAQGHGTKGAAQILDLSPKTVEAHKYNMRLKTEAHSTVDLVLAALRAGLISTNDLPAYHVEMAGPLTAISECDLRLPAPDPEKTRPVD
jgi:DNA-binding CsgD family transcriptional regulator